MLTLLTLSCRRHVHGPGLVEVKAGYSGPFTIQARDKFHNDRAIGGDMPSFCVDITTFDNLKGPTNKEGVCSLCHPCPFPDAAGVFWGRGALRDECVVLTEAQVAEIKSVGRMTSCEVGNCGIVCDNNDGTYVVQWTAIKAKFYKIEVHREQSTGPFLGVAVPNSPFRSQIVAGDTSVFGCLSTGEGRFRGIAGQPETIRVTTADLYGNKKDYGGDKFPWPVQHY